MEELADIHQKLQTLQHNLITTMGGKYNPSNDGRVALQSILELAEYVQRLVEIVEEDNSLD